MAKMTDWKRKKLWLEQETSQSLYAFEEYKHCRKTIKTLVGRKKIKSNGIYNTYHGLLSQEWIDGRYWSPFWYVMLTKVMKNT